MTPIILRPDQAALKQAIYNEWNAGHNVVAGILATGGGKCLGRDTPVLMFDGTIKMSQHVCAGDLLMGPDSQPRIVVNTTSGTDDLYRVVPVKGDSYVVNSRHLLSLRQTNRKANDPNGGSIINVPVLEYLSKNKYFRHIHKGWRTAIDFERQAPLSIEPYFLGLWLGDGNSRIPMVTTIDGPIMNYLLGYAQQLGMRFRYEEKIGTAAFNIHLIGKRSNQPTPLIDFFKRYNLRMNKHVPLDYKTASRADRLQLLAGIIDTDGHYTGKGFDIVSISETLLDDIIFVARSLGFAAYKNKVQKTCTNNGVVGTYYRCNISGDCDIIPTKLARKQASPRRQVKNVLNTGITVEPIGSGEYFGFEVAGSDNLFLLGDFTVTHNSIITTDIILDGHRDGLTEVVMAHRNELVGQMSMHVARRGIPHRIIGSSKTVSGIIQEHRAEFGRSYVNPDAKCSVGSVQTIVSRLDQLKQWGAQVDRFTGDEGHHFLRENMWGKAARLFTNARGLLVTACPQRADGAGLGSHADGIVDAMVVGPPMRELINIGALSDYEIIIPQTDFEIGEDAVTPSGDYSPKKMRDASKRSHIVSDAVTEYIRWTPGKKAICFATDVETASGIAARFNAAGIPAASVSAKTDEGVRRDMIRRFRDGRLMVLVNVDLFDEGFDVPDCEVVIMARPTASLNKFLQMLGRCMRSFFGKTHGTVIDLVSNVLRHGLPDRPRVWTLDRRDKRAKKAPDPDEIPLTACRECSRPYERCLPRCPYCGTEPVVMPGSRTPEQVDGDLVLLDRETLAQMRAAMTLEAPADIGARVARAAGEIAGRGAINRQMDRIGSQTALKEAIEQWAGIRLHGGDEERTVHRRFYLTTGMTVLQAMALTRAEMDDLRVTVEGWYL